MAYNFGKHTKAPVVEIKWSPRALSIMACLTVNRGHCDFDRNSRSLIDKYICHVQNDRTLMPHLLAGGIRSNVTCVLVPVVRV